jgi:hypothetical protein
MIRFVVYLLVLAVMLYAVFWAIDRRNRPRGQGGAGRPTPPRRPRGPLGPDDDEAFLRDLERRRREQGDQPPG